MWQRESDDRDGPHHAHLRRGKIRGILGFCNTIGIEKEAIAGGERNIAHRIFGGGSDTKEKSVTFDPRQASIG